LTPTQFVGEEEFLRQDMIASVEVNILGVIYSINAFVPLLRKGGVKKIIAISTGLADSEMAVKTGNSRFLTYSTAKAGLNMVIAKYSQELKSEGFTALALSPGVVNTKPPTTPEEKARFKAMIENFQAHDPTFKGPLSPEESVKAQYSVITQITSSETGAFLSHHGNKKWL